VGKKEKGGGRKLLHRLYVLFWKSKRGGKKGKSNKGKTVKGKKRRVPILDDAIRRKEKKRGKGEAGKLLNQSLLDEKGKRKMEVRGRVQKRDRFHS